ncbi:MAG: hypothetical protein Q8M40_07385 [Legionella sp.]|nr:hypothetical protein [Legionella sp.]
MFRYKPNTLIKFYNSLWNVYHSYNRINSDRLPRTYELSLDICEETLFSNKGKLILTLDVNKDIENLLRYLLILANIESYLTKLKTTFNTKATKTRITNAFKQLEIHIEDAVDFLEALQEKMPNLNLVKLPELIVPTDNNTVKHVHFPEIFLISKPLVKNKILPDSELIEKAVSKLVAYTKKRVEEDNYKTFFGFFSGMSREVKLNAVEKLTHLLRNEVFIEFTTKELQALKDARLGDLIDEFVEDNLNEELTRRIRKH